MIAVDRSGCRVRRASRIIQKQPDVIMQRGLIAFQCQDVVAPLIYDLLRDSTLTIERVHGHDGAL
jgi:hypothetical protein